MTFGTVWHTCTAPASPKASTCTSRRVGYTASVVTATCTECGARYETQACWLKRVKRPKCSRECNGAERGRQWATFGHMGPKAKTAESLRRAADKMRGPRNPAWKGGATYFRKHGNYKPIRYVRCPAELASMARKDGYVMEHRLLMARMAKRPLDRVEVVHHVDHDPQNNTPTNLELWPDNRSHKLAEHGRHVEGAANRVSPPVSVPRSSPPSSRSSSRESPSAEPSPRRSWSTGRAR